MFSKGKIKCICTTSRLASKARRKHVMCFQSNSSCKRHAVAADRLKVVSRSQFGSFKQRRVEVCNYLLSKIPCRPMYRLQIVVRLWSIYGFCCTLKLKKLNEEVDMKNSKMSGEQLTLFILGAAIERVLCFFMASLQRGSIKFFCL